MIYDSVPGGTGYLKQLMVDRNALLEVLIEHALPVLEQCSCVQKEGADGCYQCLYVYRNSRDMKTISRQKARDFIQQVKKLQEHVVAVDGLSNVTISSLLESELEARFIEALRRLGQGVESFECRPEFYGNKAGWFVRLGSQRYFMQPQVELNAGSNIAVASRADFVMWPLADNDSRPVVIFTDGYQYHRERVDQDCAQRLAILASGDFWVWSLSYEDVQSVLDCKPVEQFDLFFGMPKVKLQAFLERFQALSLLESRCRSSFHWLLDWLARPDANSWQAAASAFAFAGFMRASTMPGCNGAFYQSFELPDYAQSLLGDLLYSDDKTGCLQGIVLGESWQRLHLGWIVDKAAVNSGNVQKVAVHCVFDDCTALSDNDSDKRQWHGFLRMMNLIQFQPFSGFFTAKGIAENLYSGLVVNAACIAAAANGWEALLHDAVSDEERKLITILASPEMEIPAMGHELENEMGEVMAEAFLAWTDKKIALLFDEPAEDQAVFKEMGWKVFTSRELEQDSAHCLAFFGIQQ